MLIAEYEKSCWKEVTGKSVPSPELAYLVLGMAGEMGEVCEELKKSWRETGKVSLTEERKSNFINECGDVLWYMTRALNNVGSSLEEAMQANMVKRGTYGYGEKPLVSSPSISSPPAPRNLIINEGSQRIVGYGNE